MILQISLILFATHLINGQEDFNVRIINVTRGRKEMSIGTSQMNSAFIFELMNGKKAKFTISEAVFIEQINSTGWGYLSVSSSTYFPDELQAYYSGVLEAIITRPLIEAQIANTYIDYCKVPSNYCTKLKQYLAANIESVITKSRGQGGYWKMVRLLLWQIKGIQDGYDGTWKNSSKDINENYLLQLRNQIFGIFLIQLDGDLSALSEILGGSGYHSTFPGRKVIGDGSCSAFIKYVQGEIFASHVTWSPYNIMLRITKYYNFPYRVNYIEKSSPLIAGQNISFSSYPGMVSSLDDFYITSGGLITTETTIGNYNSSLWIPLRNASSSIVLEFIRTQVANRLAKSGFEWSSTFADFNSGTYNNQWMIIDTNKMDGHKYGMAIPDGVLYVLEQIPTLVIFRDLTKYLRTSYWSSYNIPFYEVVYNTSGFREMAAKYGDFFTIDKGPRAKIFKRDAHKVIDGLSLIQLMRYNDFKNDPIARCACNPPYSGENGISARCDLNLKNGTYPFGALGYRLHGGTDMKATNLLLAKGMRFVALSGPTYDQQPAFDWRLINDPSVKHYMHPVVWRFNPVLTPFP